MEKHLENICFVKLKLIAEIGEHCGDMREGMKHKDDDFDSEDVNYLDFLVGLGADLADIHDELHEHMAADKAYPYKKAHAPHTYTR